MHSNFFNPPNEYRIKPFWFLNGDLDDDELKNQLREMKEKGIGGVFICARQGLKIPYLSRKWFEKIKTICKYADSIGLENWLYDEYPYPSGISGGEVILRHPDAKSKSLVNVLKTVNGGDDVWIDLPFADVVYASAYPVNDDGAIDFTKGIDLKDDIGNLQRQEIYQRTGLTAYNTKRYFTYEPHKYMSVTLPAGTWKVIAVLQKEMENFKYYGTYVDPCDKEAMRTFIDTTHEKYKEYLGDEYYTVKGMFSDEVGLHGAIPWTRHVVAEMKTRFGYEIDDFMPALYFSTFPNAYKIRFEYYKTVHDLFKINYHKQVSDWCTENGIALATEVPSMRMSTQRYSHIVGGDTAHEKLGKSFEYIVERNLFSYRANPKSVSSLTRQLDNRFAMIESFHSVGWSMTIQDAKWMFDRMAGFGINFYNVHAYYYTMESIVKHDAPPSQFIQNAYWQHYKILGDYVGRLSVFITETDTKAKVAVLDPVTSFWSLLSNPFGAFKPNRDADEAEQLLSEKIRITWGDIRKELIYSGVDFDNLDEEILAEAVVKDGKICIGRAEYEALVLPPSFSIENDATGKIKEFVQGGGTLVSVGMLPYMDIDSENVAETYKAMFDENKNCHFIPMTSELYGQKEHNTLLEALHPLGDWSVNIAYDEQFNKTMLVTRRYDLQGALFLFVSNQENNTVGVTLMINVNEPCHFEEYLLIDGSSKVIPVEGNKITIEFKPFDSKILKLVKGGLAVEKSEPRQVLVFDTEQIMDVSICGENVLPFDTFEFSADKTHWVNVDVSTADNQITAAGFAGEQVEVKDQGFGLPKRIEFTYPKELYYKKNFYCDYVPENINLLMDESTVLHEYEIFINGNKIDKSKFKKIFVNDIKNIICPLTGLLSKGENEILVQVTANNNWGGIRDNIYLSGDFTVLKNVEHGLYIAKPSGKAKLTHTYIEGYPFYCGTISFKSALNVASKTAKSVLTLSDKKIYDCVEIILNGKSLGVKAFTPYEWEIGEDGLNEGLNEIEIKVTNTLIGMLEGGYFDYDLHQFVKI